MDGSMKSGSNEQRIILRDQLEEQDKLIEILRDRIGAFEEALSPLLVPEPDEAESGMKEPDVGPALSPVQAQVMLQYNRLNMLISRLENIRRRVQL